MAEYAPSPDPREGLHTFGGFMGLRNNVSSESFGPDDLEVALNVDIDDALGVSRRKGYSAPVTAAVDRDLWASGGVCLGVGSNALKRVLPDWSTVTLRSGLTASRPLAYAAAGDRVFYANGAEMGCVQAGEHRTWGIAVPGMPVGTAGAGALRAGRYQYALTYIRDDGQESGAGRAGVVTLPAAGGIELTEIPVSADPTITHKAVYITPTDGAAMYRAGVIGNAVTAFDIREPQMGASPLLTQFLSPPPAGEHLGYWKGWMLVAAGARMYPSEPFAPELFDLRKAVPFLDRITMVAPLRDGVWIGTDSQVIWLSGDSPEAWVHNLAAEYGVIPGTLAYSDQELIGGAQAGEVVAFFATKQGLCAGRPGGSLVNLTQARFSYPAMDRGAGVVRRHRGLVQYLATLRGAEVAANAAA